MLYTFSHLLSQAPTEPVTHCNRPGVNRWQLFLPKPARILLGFHTPDCKKLASKVTVSKFKTKVEERVQNNNIKLESFTDVDIDERTEPEVTESKFKTEVEEKVQNNNVELESFTDVDIDEGTEPEVTEIKFKTDNLVKINKLRVDNLLQTNCQFVCNYYSYEAK